MGRGEVRPRLPAGWAPPGPSGSPGWALPLGAPLPPACAAAGQSRAWPCASEPLQMATWRPPAAPTSSWSSPTTCWTRLPAHARQPARGDPHSSSVWAALAARQSHRLGKGRGPRRGQAEGWGTGRGRAWVRYLLG